MQKAKNLKITSIVLCLIGLIILTVGVVYFLSSDYYYYESEWLRLLGMASDFDFYNYEYGTDIYDTMWYWYRYYSALYTISQ
jgi:hypothetical protein